MKKLFTLAFIAACLPLVGCFKIDDPSSPYKGQLAFEPLGPDGQPGGYLRYTVKPRKVPAGTTDTTATTAATSAALRADQLQREIDALYAHLGDPAVQADPVRVRAVHDEIDRKERLQGALLNEAGLQAGALVVDEESPQGRTEPVSKTLGEHTRDIFWDYRDAWEAVKTSLSQGGAGYSLASLGNAAGVWKIREAAFYQRSTGGDNSSLRVAGEALQASATRDADQINASGNSRVEIRDQEQGRRLIVDASGNAEVLVDKEQGSGSAGEVF